MVVVEQSLAVAARLADRVVFVEKGSDPLRRRARRPHRRRGVGSRGVPGWTPDAERAAVITLHGWDVSQQMLLSGIVQGLAYAVLGAGIVLVYRASGVINFAVAAFGTTALAFMAVLLGGGVADWHPPFWLAFVIATVAAALAGSLAEWAVIRRLADAPRLVVLVATIGIAQVLLLVALLLPDVFEGGFFPPLLDWTWTASPELLVQGRDWSVLVVIPVLVLALAVFLTRTRMGLMVRASAANPDKARLVGIRVFRTANVVWAISAALAAVAAIALAPVRGVSLAGRGRGRRCAQLPAVAARAGGRARWRGCGRCPVALVAGIGVGHRRGDPPAERRPERPRGDRAVAVRGDARHRARVLPPVARRSTTAGGRSPRRLRRATVDAGGPWWSRHLGRIGVVALFGVLVLIPVFFSRASESFLWTRVLIFAIAGCSLTILTGWAGQVSLGQFGFAAVGGLVTVKLVGDDGILGLHHLPWGVAVADRRARRARRSRCSSACPRCASPASTSR